jgi:hypothetical protein
LLASKGEEFDVCCKTFEGGEPQTPPDEEALDEPETEPSSAREPGVSDDAWSDESKKENHGKKKEKKPRIGPRSQSGSFA